MSNTRRWDDHLVWAHLKAHKFEKSSSFKDVQGDIKRQLDVKIERHLTAACNMVF